MNCNFCGKDITPGLGFRVFRRDGSFQAFCSNKCFANAKMKRSPRKLKWTGQKKLEKEQRTKAAVKQTAKNATKASNTN